MSNQILEVKSLNQLGLTHDRGLKEKGKNNLFACVIGTGLSDGGQIFRLIISVRTLVRSSSDL